MDPSSLLNLLRLIEVVKLPVEVLLYQLIEVLADLIKVHELSVLLHIRVRAVLLVCGDCGHGFEGLALLWIDYDHVGEDLGKFLSVEDLRGLTLITRVVDIEDLIVLLEDCFELAHIPRHVQRWRVDEKERLGGLALRVLELAAEVLKVWVENEFNVESALEALVEDVDRELLSLDPPSL